MTARPVRLAAVFGALLALLASACGSTAQYHGQPGAASAEAGLDAPAGAAAGGPSAAHGDAVGPGGNVASSGGPAQPAAAGPSAPNQSAGASSASVPATGSAAPHSTTAAGPGITATKIFFGVSFSSQSAAGDKAIGAAGAAPSYDARDVFNAVINYANSHGGFAGRQLEAIYYDINIATDRSTEDQAACSSWTQDHKVFALLGGSDILDGCAENAGAVAIGGGSETASTYKKFPHMFSPNTMRLDRLAAITANGLFSAGYFSGKLGLVTWDDPDYRYTVSQGYLPALSSHGITPTETAYITVPQQINAVADTSSAIGSAVTKFLTAGIDHVIVQDGPAGVFGDTALTLEWMNQAKSQQYYPRYGQNAHNTPGWAVLPADQMDHAVAIDSTDYDPKYDQGWHSNPARDLCFKIESDAGFPVQANNVNDEYTATSACDDVFLMQRVINNLPSITADSFVHAVTGLGTSFQPAFVYGSKFAGQRDGGGEVRTEDYSAGCQCLTYRGAPYYAD